MTLPPKVIRAFAEQVEHTPPIDCLRELLKLYREEQVVSLEFFLHALHVAVYVVDKLAADIDRQHGYGDVFEDEPFDELLHELFEELVAMSYDPVTAATKEGISVQEMELPGAAFTARGLFYLSILRLLISQLPIWLKGYLPDEAIQAIVSMLTDVIEKLIR